MRKSFIPIFLSAAGAASVAVAAPPLRVEIEYELNRNGTAVAAIVHRLEHDKKTYTLWETWQGKGVFALAGKADRSSRGAVAADGLRPVEFEDKRTGRETRRAGFDAADKSPTLERQDQLSMAWSFAFAPPRGTVNVRVADGKKVTPYAYAVAGRERVKTPAGEFDGLKLVKQKDSPQAKSTEIWLAADRDYLPVRVLIVEKDGTRLDQLATKISPK
jgi:Protein of unknown function (DUF3108)